MAGYIGTQAVSVNTTSATISDDLAVGDDATIAGDATVTGVITGSTVEATGDTAAGDNAAMGYTAAEGLILTGQGSTNDVTIKNDADADVIEIPTGTVNVTMAGSLKIIDTELAEASDNFSINIQSGNNDFQVKSGGTIFAAFKGSAKDLQLTSGNLVIGTAGKGIDFAAQTPTSVTGASASGAEILDHYEEGAWTPVVAGLTLSAVSANYTRIGDMVHFGFTITMPSTSATTHMKVTGAPFSITTNVFGGSLIFTESATVNSLIIGIASSNEIQFYAPQAAFATYANFSGAIVRVSGAFKTDSA